jgi:hypothetical protein
LKKVLLPRLQLKVSWLLAKRYNTAHQVSTAYQQSWHLQDHWIREQMGNRLKSCNWVWHRWKCSCMYSMFKVIIEKQSVLCLNNIWFHNEYNSYFLVYYILWLFEYVIRQV